MNLEVHHYCQHPFGEQALLIYQAHVHQDWHDHLKQNKGFNLAVINKSLLQSIHCKVMDRAQADSWSQVSFLPLFKYLIITNLVYLPSSSSSNTHPFISCYMLQSTCSYMLHLLFMHALTFPHVLLLATHATCYSIHYICPPCFISFHECPHRVHEMISAPYKSGSHSSAHCKGHSCSPTHLHASPPPYQQSQASPKQSPFPSGAPAKALSVCTLCLGWDPHHVYKCTSEICWDGSKTRCHRNKQGRLISPAGSVLCLNWNSHCGCTTTRHESHHKCSGCGNKDHGAQACPQAQKVPGSHSL